MLNKIKEMIRGDAPAYLRSFILMPGHHDIMLSDIEGISLKLVTRDVMVAHKGLKYWVAAYTPDVDILSTAVVDILSIRARTDLLDLMFFKKPPQHKGFVVKLDGRVFEGDLELGTVNLK